MKMPYTPFEYGTTHTFEEKAVLYSNFWRVSTGIQSLASTGIYATLHFRTPINKQTLYYFSSISKSGDDVSIVLIEGGTYVGGSGTTPWCLDRRNVGISGLTDVKFGISPGTTITGGISAPENYMGGTGLGTAKAGGTTEPGAFVYCLPDTEYTVKVTALGTSTKVNILASIVVLD